MRNALCALQAFPDALRFQRRWSYSTWSTTSPQYTMIPWEIAEALGYKPEMLKEKVTLITASGVETASLIEIKKIKFLGEGLDNVPVVCHDLPPESYVTGLLGSSFLRHFKITIDYPKGIFGRSVPRKPRLVGGVKGHNMNETSSPGSPALWAGSFTFQESSQIIYKIILTKQNKETR